MPPRSFLVFSHTKNLPCEYCCGLIHTGAYIVWGCNTPSVCVLFVRVGPEDFIGRKKSVRLKSERHYHFVIKHDINFMDILLILKIVCVILACIFVTHESIYTANLDNSLKTHFDKKID